jgi:nitroimidazol reductase NimA-like FMN-containing flavoprotein (pyridoxamine 5'-phosphate oxidase superfamily)
VAKLDLSLTGEEMDDYLAARRTLRLATCGPAGDPQVVPLWFVWVDGTVFVNTTMGNLTVRNAEARPRVAATVDDGESYDQLRGVVFRGRLEAAGDDARLDEVREAFSVKYFEGREVPFDRWRSRVWLRLVPDHTASWDFRKIPEARARRAADTS